MTKPFAVVALFTLPHKTHINKLMCTKEYQRLLRKIVECKILMVYTQCYGWHWISYAYIFHQDTLELGVGNQYTLLFLSFCLSFPCIANRQYILLQCKFCFIMYGKPPRMHFTRLCDTICMDTQQILHHVNVLRKNNLGI